jgi:hypothetical protein
MISRRTLEVATATLTGVFGVVVVVSSTDNGIGWSSAGVESGTFPFIIGLIILAASLYNLVHGLWRARGVVVERAGLMRTAALFVPVAIYVAAIPLAGMYAASGAYLLFTLRIQSKLSLLRSVVIAVVSTVVLYVVFERLFEVSLPHGLLGAWLER